MADINLGRVLGPRGRGLEFNATGLFANRALYNAQPVPFSFLATDQNLVYYREGEGWSVGLSVNNRKDLKIKPFTPAYIEQFTAGFFGRGMLTDEPINIYTQTPITSSTAVSGDVVGIASTTNFVVGSTIVIKYANGLYLPYFVTSKSGVSLGIQPSLAYAVDTSCSLERTWYNKAHAGKYYMRYLAQRIANGNELDCAVPAERVLFTDMTSDVLSLKDDVIAVGAGTTVNYYYPQNIGESIDRPVRFSIGRTAYVDFNGLAKGIQTQYFKVDFTTKSQYLLSFSFMTNNSTINYLVEVLDENNRIICEKKLLSNKKLGITTIHRFPLNPSNAKKIKVKITTAQNSYGYFLVSQFDLFASPSISNNEIISIDAPVIVGIGDSWIAGDEIAYPERESILTQLALEIPDATIVNKGVGGRKIQDVVAAFDADLAGLTPDYIVVSCGTNDCYSPGSGTFYPNAANYFIDQYNILISKIISIGARPIIIGVPALCQTDADVSLWDEWLLNDRARIYARTFYRDITKNPDLEGINENYLNITDSVIVPTPTSPGTTGEIRNIYPFRYECIFTNTWTRTAIEITW